MTTRRGFLGAMLAAGVAPAFVGSSVLMPLRRVWVPDDADRLQAMLDQGGIIDLNGKRFDLNRPVFIRKNMTYFCGGTLAAAESFKGHSLLSIENVRGVIVKGMTFDARNMAPHALAWRGY